MGLESATFTDDLDTTNPVSGDPKSQGDDHLRLIKSVLRNSFKRVSRAFYVPNTVAKSANYTVLVPDDNRTIVCDTTTAFTLTLPVGLVASDAGWCVYVLKTTADANPVWIAPPSGTINGFTKIRRSVRSKITKVLWTGSVFEASRDGPPIGSLIEFYGATLPQGMLWPNGVTFSATDYVELNAVLGTNLKPERRGRVAAGRTDMGGIGVLALVTTAGSGIDGTVLGANGGAEAIFLARANLPNDTVTVAITDPGHAHNTEAVGATLSAGATNTPQDGGGQAGGVVVANTTGITAQFALNGGVTQTLTNKMPPTVIANFGLVAE